MADRTFSHDPGRLSLEPLIGRITDEEAASKTGLTLHQVAKARYHGVGLFDADWWASRFGRLPYEVWGSEWEEAASEDPIVASRHVLRPGSGTRVVEGELLFTRRSGMFGAVPLYETTDGAALTIDPTGERLSPGESVEVGLSGPGAQLCGPLPLPTSPMVSAGYTDAGHLMAYWPEKRRLVAVCPRPKEVPEHWECRCSDKWRLGTALGPGGQEWAAVVAPDGTMRVFDRDTGRFVGEGEHTPERSSIWVREEDLGGRRGPMRPAV